MAVIALSQSGKNFTIDRWLGLNESPDGDTGLKFGEAAKMRNARITKEGHLQLVRPGYDAMVALADGHPVRGLWHGFIGGVEKIVGVCNGHAYSLNLTTFEATDLGTLTDAPTTFFEYSNKLYFLNGHEYKSWNGTTFADVAGYVPITFTTCAPATGGGTALEQANKLNGSRIMWFSGDGTATYKLTESSITSVDEVRVGGVLKTVTTHYTVNASTGTVTFTSGNFPDSGTNNVTIKYTKGTGDRATILAQKFSEIYNGATDARVFVYGDGTNKCYYSGIEYTTGLPSAEYFPDLNVVAVDTENTPITNLIRHYGSLVLYKSNSNYSATYDYLTLDDGSVTAGFNVVPINRDIGNAAMGQVRLVGNNPLSLYMNGVYEWASTSVRDERNAKRISDRVLATLKTFDLASAITFDDQYNFEYWVLCGTTAVIYNYAVDAWYTYTNIPATCFVQIDGEVYFGTSTGKVMKMSSAYHSDDGADIDALWESGSMYFNDYTYRKRISKFYPSLLPEVGARIMVTFETNEKSDFEDKPVSNNVLNFTHIDFAHWSFRTNKKPQIRGTRLKAKNFVFLKLIMSSISSSATATVLSVTLPITYTGKVK